MKEMMDLEVRKRRVADTFMTNRYKIEEHNKLIQDSQNYKKTIEVENRLNEERNI